MPTVFAIVGQHQDDPDRLLLLGSDGQHYQYQLLEDKTTPVEPEDDAWRIDPDPPPFEELTE